MSLVVPNIDAILVNTRASGAARTAMTPQIPIRVFVLSSSRFLGEALARVMRKTADVLVVGARPYSIDAPAEIIDSSCDVLLTDSATVLALDSQVPEQLRRSFSLLKVVMIEMDDKESASSKLARKGVTGYLLKEAAVADVISTIRGVALGEAVNQPRIGTSWPPRGISSLDPTAP